MHPRAQGLQFYASDAGIAKAQWPEMFIQVFEWATGDLAWVRWGPTLPLIQGSRAARWEMYQSGRQPAHDC